MHFDGLTCEVPMLITMLIAFLDACLAQCELFRSKTAMS